MWNTHAIYYSVIINENERSTLNNQQKWESVDNGGAWCLTKIIFVLTVFQERLSKIKSIGIMKFVFAYKYDMDACGIEFRKKESEWAEESRLKLFLHVFSEIMHQKSSTKLLRLWKSASNFNFIFYFLFHDISSK